PEMFQRSSRLGRTPLWLWNWRAKVDRCSTNSTSTSESAHLDVYDPYREEILHRVSAGSAIDVDREVTSAHTTLAERKRAGGAERATYLRAVASKPRARPKELAQLSARVRVLSLSASPN